MQGLAHAEIVSHKIQGHKLIIKGIKKALSHQSDSAFFMLVHIKVTEDLQSVDRYPHIAEFLNCPEYCL